MGGYWAEVFCKALDRTKESIGWNKRTIIRNLVGYVIGFPVYFLLREWKEVMEETYVLIAFLIAPFALIAIWEFFWNFVSLPYEMDTGLRVENNSLNERISKNIKSLEIASYLENAWGSAEYLLSRTVDPRDEDVWSNDARIWFLDTQKLLDEHLPRDEAYAFKTYATTGQFDQPGYLEERNRLHARMTKLRLITARYLKEKN